MKNTVEQLTAFSTQHNIKNAEDVANLLRSTDSNIMVTNFDERDIENTFQIIPGDLTSLKGATKFHEISVASDGILRVKELPTDRAYKTTRLRGRGGLESGLKLLLLILMSMKLAEAIN